MTLYRGENLVAGEIHLGSVQPSLALAARKDPDVAASVERWLLAAAERDDVIYFGIYRSGELFGQILLHDVDPSTQEALVAYHLFEARYRRAWG
jgi:hypothetical protein